MSYENYSAKGLLVEFGQLSSKRTEAINEHSKLKKIAFVQLTQPETKKNFLEPARQKMAAAEEEWNICRNEVLRRLEWFDENRIEAPKEVLLKELGAILRRCGRDYRSYGFDYTGIWDEANRCAISDDYFDKKIFYGSLLLLKSDVDPSGGVHSFQSENGFTRREVLDAVLTVESKTRPNSDWFGQPDWHHIFFEGIHFDKSGVGKIYWGS